jgi:hypothetical protein
LKETILNFQTFFGKKTNVIRQENLLMCQLQNENNCVIDWNVLNAFLQNKNYKHQIHLQYLAERHERTILKIRFVLNPFSFVFLLAGKEGFHIILETLNTEEATYIWHFDNNKRALPDKLKQVDNYLTSLKTMGDKYLLKIYPRISAAYFMIIQTKEKDL